jgi:hypothetical protein
MLLYEEVTKVGYTHYWYVKGPLDKKDWNIFSKEARAIVGEAMQDGISIKGPSGGGNPIFNAERVMFNGNADRDEDYESFIVTRKGSDQISGFDGSTKGFSFDCCKTRGDRPYDEVVVAVLFALQERFPATVRISSDGSVKDGEFTKGVDLFERALGRSCDPIALLRRENDPDEQPDEKEEEEDTEEEERAELCTRCGAELFENWGYGYGALCVQCAREENDRTTEQTAYNYRPLL